jgi:hypothetical protein
MPGRAPSLIEADDCPASGLFLYRIDKRPGLGSGNVIREIDVTRNHLVRAFNDSKARYDDFGVPHVDRPGPHVELMPESVQPHVFYNWQELQTFIDMCLVEGERAFGPSDAVRPNAADSDSAWQRFLKNLLPS